MKFEVHLVLLFVLVVLTGANSCRSPEVAAAPPEWQQWRERRQESVAGTNGWTTLVGLQWLDEGTNQLLLPTAAGPVLAGVMVRSGPEADFLATPEAQVHFKGQPVIRRRLLSDAHGADPDILTRDTVRFHLIQRGDRLGVRIKDVDAVTRRKFTGLDYFDYDPEWRLDGWFEPFDPPRVMVVHDVTGASEPQPSPGVLRFEKNGREFRLEALFDEETQDYFVLFRDRTAGRTTYGSGRFLHVAPGDASGRVTIDFNYAYNPPCAFTSHATCPLPPRQNWLPLEISVGERSPRETNH